MVGRDLAVVECSSWLVDAALLHQGSQAAVHLRQRLEDVSHVREHRDRQVLTVGARVGCRLVLLVQRLAGIQHGLGLEAVARRGLLLERAEVIGQGCGFFPG
ncbi:hypothetical protein D9M69_727180 [compost metagenome]